MTTITINDPITWWERRNWLYARDQQCVDTTNWQAWQVGIDDIFISVDSEVATLYYLTWPQT
jgi:hypothetical protein